MPGTKTPIALYCYNRPEHLRRVIGQLRLAKVKKLYIFADSAKNPVDEPLCQAVKKIATEEIDWDCQAAVNFAKKNLGCQKSIITGLNKVFEQEEMAIILEDDCLPSVAFFSFCEQMLRLFKNESQIFQISGFNHFDSFYKKYKGDYFFSRFGSVWGWATSRNRWEIFQKMSLEFYEDDFAKINFINETEVNYFKNNWRAIQAGKLDSWAYILNYARLRTESFAVVPKVNLVRNIGLLADSGTHTKGRLNIFAHKKIPHKNIFRNQIPKTHKEISDDDKYKFLYTRINMRTLKSRQNLKRFMLYHYYLILHICKFL